ncbi:hypothetical protein ABMA27_000325 [Loxostege sticticalis]|uniref:Uncharacterized protein n=1 Tax=Loxostege sticticalis TaxID=481309 RepID=A0ABR3IN12_LOXSC
MSMEKENRPPKRQRTENWLEEDKYLLKELVKERENAIKKKQTLTRLNERLRLGLIHKQRWFNSVCAGVNCSITQLKTQWSLINGSKAKKIRSSTIMEQSNGTSAIEGAFRQQSQLGEHCGVGQLNEASRGTSATWSRHRIGI